MTIVVKVGGALGNAIAPVVDDLVGRSDVVLVHGGSAEVDRVGNALGVPPEYFTSPSGVVSRRSDARHLEAVVLALAGKVQTELVQALGSRGVRALGLSGVDGRLLLARRKTAVRARVGDRVVRLSDELAGTVETVDVPLLRTLLGAGYLPVVGPPAITPEGEIVNVDADQVAAAVAASLKASDLVLLTNVPGLLRAPPDPASLVERIPRDEVEPFLELAAGRMRKKLLAARDACRAGVARAVIAPSGVPTPVRRALEGHGTVVA